MKRRMFRSPKLRAGSALAGALLLGVLLIGCGQRPLRVGVTTGSGPGAREWTVNVSATGDGQADASVVLGYPDGHVDPGGSKCDFLVSEHVSGGSTLESLVPGTYRWTVYAIRVKPAVLNVFTLPARDRIPRNVVASGSFVIP